MAYAMGNFLTPFGLLRRRQIYGRIGLSEPVSRESEKRPLNLGSVFRADGKGLIDMSQTKRYSFDMPIDEVQAQILRTLSGEKSGIAVAELVSAIRRETQQAPVSIRAAILPLISIRQLELTPDRKLRLRA